MSNLPDDVTPGDIDKHFGPPDMEMTHCDVSVAVSVEVPEHYSDEEVKQKARKQAKDGNIEQVLEVYIGEREPCP